jgi:putative membrane-bound dehydrogenase-like protein
MLSRSAVVSVIASIGVLIALPRLIAQLRPESSGPILTVPSGFTIERVAGPPLVNRPIVADFDEEGRLYVADSSGSNDRPEKQVLDRPHRILRLEDTDGDGRYDRSVVFADGMMLPEGTMWFDGSLYVAAPPSIWKLTDTDGDGVADRREEWFKGETLTGCANDLHGPYLGPDGWIYWTKGAFAQQTHARDGKEPLISRAAHILRRRPSRNDYEVVMTGGMDNPVDVAFTSSGERILTATFVEHPQAGRRDGIVHAIYGGLYGKPHAVLDGHVRTGDLMPVMCQLGPDVPAGLTRYASSVFGRDYQDNFFAAMFNLRKVTRHVLEPSGATFTTRDTDFVVSTDRDFHPTDVVEDADGSLLVLDTGPWYKLCCPTSQLAKPDTLGAIYRVRRTSAAAVKDPRGRALSWDTMPASALANLLADPRPAVQGRALFQFSKFGAPGVRALQRAAAAPSDVVRRRNAVWALTRIDDPSARETVRSALADADDSVAAAAAHSAGLWRDRAATPALRALLRKRSGGVQRAAAEALGRAGDATAIPDLLASETPQADRVLEHSLTYALIEIGDAPAIARSAPGSVRARRAALFAIDQIAAAQQKSEAVVPLLGAPEKELQEAAWWVAARHPEWGDALAAPIRTQLARVGATPDERRRLQQRIVSVAAIPAVQQVIADLVAADGPTEGRVTGLRVIAEVSAASAPAATRIRELPAAWASAVQRALADSNEEVVRHAVSVARTLPPNAASQFEDALMRLARESNRTREIRLQALSAVPGTTPLPGDLFELLQSSLLLERPSVARAMAVDLASRRRLSPEQLRSLLPALTAAGPLELPRLLAAFDNDSDESLGLAMIAALEGAQARAALRPDVLRPRLAKYPETVKAAGEKLLGSLHADAGSQSRRLQSLLASLPAGDLARGQRVFNSERAGCVACHQIGYGGGRIGPDLTRIGQVRGDSDLLESIIYPSVSFARGYEPVVVRTTTGDFLSGVQRTDDGEEIVVADATGKETRVSRRAIADMQPGTVSLMPAGLGEILTAQELADLVAFLRAAR